jgi:hypothetical protein
VVCGTATPNLLDDLSSRSVPDERLGFVLTPGDPQLDGADEIGDGPNDAGMADLRWRVGGRRSRLVSMVVEPNEGDILAALGESGFLMEQEVATALEEAGLHAETGRAYLDPEEGKSRELDVVGFLRHSHDEARRRLVTIRLLCECKNTARPFVFLARRKTQADLLRNPQEYLFPLREVAVAVEGGTQYVPPFHTLGLASSQPSQGPLGGGKHFGIHCPRVSVG